MWFEATKAARWKLTSPETAEFPEPGAPGTSIEKRNDHYVVQGFVRARNRLGEMVRIDFRCVAARLPDTEEWVCRRVQFTEE